MKKFIVGIGFMGFMMLLMGCDGFFNVVKKDTVMVKKINAAHEKNEVEYEGVLSMDTIQMLSLNAVDKYFDEKLTKNEMEFELMKIDANNLWEMLTLLSKQDAVIDVQTELDKVPNGLFEIILSRQANPKEEYHLILNAQNGDVLKASKWMNYLKGGEIQLYFRNEGLEENQKEELAIVNQFIQEKGNYPLSDLTLIGSVGWGEAIVEYYYMYKDDPKVSYSIVVNEETKQVMEFSKDLMAILNYFP